MTLNQFMLILRARWWLALGIFCTFVGAMLLVSLLSVKQYRASASIIVDGKGDPSDPASSSGVTAQSMASYIATQVDIIASPRVARRVAEDLKLDQSKVYQDQWRRATGGEGDLAAWIAETKIQSNLMVTPSRESNVVDISVQWTDPKHAAELANAFAQAYINTSIELKVEPAKQFAAWFDDRARSLRADLEAKQKKLSDYEGGNGIVVSDARMDIESARLGELSTQLLTMQALLQDSQSKQRQTSGDNESLPEVLQSSLVASLKSDLSRAEAKLQDIATSLGKNHPDYQNTEAGISSLRRRIDQESAKIAASLGSTMHANMLRESDIRAALEAQKKRMLDLKHQRDQASVLTNDVVTAQRNLDAVASRLAQSNLASHTQQTNIVVLTPAVPPARHYSPKLFLNLVMGALFGTLFGIGAALFLEMLNRRVRSEAELIHLLGVPVLGIIRKIPVLAHSESSVTGLMSLKSASI